MEEPIKFYKTEVGKVVSYGIHEHCHGLSSVGGNITLLKRLLERECPEVFNKEETQKYFTRISEGLGKSTDSVDYIYEKLKEKYETGDS